MKLHLVVSTFAAAVGVASGRLTAPHFEEPEDVTVPLDDLLDSNETRGKLTSENSSGRLGRARELLGPCGGGDRGNEVCADTSLCCSQWGWCGNTFEHCTTSYARNPTAKPPTNAPAPAPTPAASGGGGGGGNCPGGFDPNGTDGEATGQLASYHEEYRTALGNSLTVNCDDMAKFTLGQGNELVAAMYTGQYGGGKRCGSCVLVEGPQGSAVVTIIDKCECDGPGSALDLSETAFKQINGGSLAAGVVPIKWRTVSCDINTGRHLHYRFKQGSTIWWMELHVAYSVDPIEVVEVLIDGRYREMEIREYGYWGFKGSVPTMKPPLQIRLTSTAGQVINDQLSSIQYSQSVLVSGDNKVQFTPGCSVN